MIQSKSDLYYFLDQDRKALSMPQLKGLRRIKEFFFPDEIWKFERLLRYTEYFYNNRRSNILHWGETVRKLRPEPAFTQAIRPKS